MGDLTHPQTPLVGTLQVADPLACVDHEAANGLDRVGVGHLAPDGRRGGGVEARHPFRDPPRGHQRKPTERDREHLHVHRTHFLGNPDRLGGARDRRLRVVLGQKRHVGPHVRYVRACGRRRTALDEHRGALAPADGLGDTAKGVGVVAELHGQAGGSVRVAGDAREPIALLVSGECPVRIERVAGGDAETFIAVGRRAIAIAWEKKPRALSHDPRASAARPASTSFSASAAWIFAASSEGRKHATPGR